MASAGTPAPPPPQAAYIRRPNMTRPIPDRSGKDDRVSMAPRAGTLQCHTPPRREFGRARAWVARRSEPGHPGCDTAHTRVFNSFIIVQSCRPFPVEFALIREGFALCSSRRSRPTRAYSTYDSTNWQGLNNWRVCPVFLQ